MNRLLKRQIKKLFGENVPNTPEFIEFLNLVDGSYNEFEANYNHLEHVLETSAKESFKELTNFKNGINAAAIVSITDNKGNIVAVNDNFCKISGYNREELIGKNHRIINAGYHDEAFWLNFWKTILAGEIWKGEICNRAKDGSIYWVSTSIIPFLNDKGIPHQFLSIRFDISKRKKIEAEINRLALVAKNTQNTVIITDTNRKIEWVNPAFEQLTGYTFDEVKGKSPGEILQGADTSKETINEIREKLNNKLPYEGEILNYTKTGKAYWLSLTITPIFEHNEHIGYIAIENDVTARVNNENRLAQNEKTLKAANKASGILLQSNKSFEALMNDALACIGTQLDVDRVYVFRNHLHEGNAFLSQTFEWSCNTTTPQINNPDLQNLPYYDAGFGRWYEQLSSKNVLFGIVNNFPEEEHELLKSQDIKSILVAPIFIGNYFWGFVGFDDCHSEREWNTSEQEILVNLANNIGAAYERNDATERLQQSEQKFRLLIESATDIFYNTDAFGHFTYVNDIAAKITGYSTEELLQMNYLDLVEPSYRKVVQKHYHDQSNSGINVTYNEFPILTKSGEVKWVGQNVQLISEHGKITAIQAIARDITKLIKTQNELKQSREFVSNVLNAIPNPVFVKNRKHEWVVVNQAFADLIGKPIADILGQTDEAIISTENAAKYLKFDEQLFDAKEGAEYEDVHFNPLLDKQVSLIIKKSYLNANNQEFLVAVLTDITEIKDRQRELILLNNIINQISDAISVADYDGNLVYVNQSHANNLNKTTQELIGSSVVSMEKLFANVSDWQTHFNEVKAKGELLVEGQNIKADGSYFPVEANVKYTNIEGKELIVATIRDITERKKMLQEVLDKSQILNVILTNLPVVLYKINMHGEFTQLVGKGLARVGLKENQLVGQKALDVYTQEQQPVMHNNLKEAITDKTSKYFIMEGYDEAGTWYFDNFTFPDETTEDAIIGFALDITERKKAEEKLVQSEQRFRMLVQNATDITTILTKEGNLVYESPSFYRLLGYNEVEILGRNVFEFIHPEDIPVAMAEFKKGLEKGGISDPVEFRFKHKNGHWVYLESIGNNLLNNPGINGIVINSRDITERKFADNKLVQTKNFYEQILNEIPTDIAVFDTNHTYLFVNKKAIADDEKRNWIIGKTDYDFCEKYNKPIAVADSRRSIFNKVVKDKLLLSFEEKGMANGKPEWVFRRMYPVVGANEEVINVIGFGLDITERKLAEEKLKESEERLKLAVKSASMGIWDWNLITNEIEMDEGMHNVFGRDLSDYKIFAKFGSLILADDFEKVNEKLNDSFTNHTLFECIFRVYDTKNNIRYIKAFAEPFYDDNDKPFRMIGVDFDVTNDMLAQEKIAKQQSELEEAQHLARVGGWEYYTATRQITWTKEMYVISEVDETLFNPTLAATLGLYNRETREEAIGLFRQAINQNKPFEFEGLATTKNGVQLFVRTRGIPIIENNTTVGLRGVLQDITKEKIAQQKLSEYAEELEKKNKELDQFAYVVSHDLKAPLRGIENLSNWIEEDMEGNLPADVQKNFDLLRSRVKRMENLINGILQYSRAGRMKYEKVAFNVTEIVNEIVEALSPNQKFTVNVQPNMPELVSERIAFEQVMTNYISNAIKYNNNEQPTISVYHKKNGEFFEFCVEDNGPGIAKEYHEKVFGIFQTLQSRDTVESTGVGLAIVKKMVEDKGGKVWIDSDEGKGTKFYFSWPVKE